MSSAKWLPYSLGLNVLNMPGKVTDILQSLINLHWYFEYDDSVSKHPQQKVIVYWCKEYESFDNDAHRGPISATTYLFIVKRFKRIQFLFTLADTLFCVGAFDNYLQANLAATVQFPAHMLYIIGDATVLWYICMWHELAKLMWFRPR